MEEMNTLKPQKCQEEFEKFLKESPLQNTIHRISREIVEQKNSAAALEFTRIICDLLKNNGVHVKCTEYQSGEEITQKCAFEFGLDFSERDQEISKEAKEEAAQRLSEQIARLGRIQERKSKEIEKLTQENNELKTDNAEMHCELQAINANPINDYVKELEDRHQSDCIRINQMSTTIDILVDKLAKARETFGL